MSMKFRDKDGNETLIAGMGRSGELVPSVSYYQSGTASFSDITSQATETITVTLDTAMPDSDYVVVLNVANGVGYVVTSKSASAFTIRLQNLRTSTVSAGSFTWQAFKLMTDESRALDEAQIAENKADIATLKTSVATNTTDITALKTRTQAVCTSVKIKANGLTARKSGKIVTVNGVTQFSADLTRDSWIEIATLPSGYRPSNYEYGTAVIDSVACPIDVDASGSMRVFIYGKSIPSTTSLADHYVFISLCFTTTSLDT